MAYDATTQSRPEARPVTHADPAWFACGRLLKDGSPNPDYGKVFAERVAQGQVAYYFDRRGNSHCCTMPDGAMSGWLAYSGRSFEIAGVVS